jgi:hypothetical protein
MIRIFRLASLFFLIMIAGWFTRTQSATAAINLNPNPGAGDIPAAYRTYLRNCDGGTQSPAFVQWIAPRNAPSAPANITVNPGQPSVLLDFHFAGAVCFSPSGTLATRMRIMSETIAPNGRTNAVGRVLGFDFAPQESVPGTYRHDFTTFSFIPPGGFPVTPGTYTYSIGLDNRPINFFGGSDYRCVAPPGQSVSGYNYSACPRTIPTFTIRVTVSAPPVDAGSCSLTAPTAVYPGATYSVSFTANNTGDFNWSVNNGLAPRYRLRDPTFAGVGVQDVDIQGPGVESTGFGPILRFNRSTTWTRSFTAPTVPGRYTLDRRIYGSNDGTVGGLHYVGATCSQTLDVVERPYFRTFGGDVFTGAGQGPGCQVDTNASIIGITDTQHTAAGSQLANMALGLILDTASSQQQGGTTTPNRLSFANSGAQADGLYTNGALYTAFGGGLSTGNAACAPDFWDGATAIQPSGYPINSPLNLGMGQRETVYVDGDVFINDNITYANGAYNNIDQIPSYRIVARGNIYVAPSVSELNGVFVALPRPGSPNTSGRFYTCWPGHTPTAVDMNTTCRSTRLTVYGAVVADLIKLTRSSGSANRSSALEAYDGAGAGLGSAAERFIYTPEVWLTSQMESGDGGDLDSLLSLPPVL